MLTSPPLITSLNMNIVKDMISMKRFISLLIITALIASFLAGCTGGNDVSDYTGPIFTSEYAFRSFAITPDTEVYGLSPGQPVGKYTSDGELLDTYPGTEGFNNLCYSDGFLYALDWLKVVKIDVNSKTIRSVAELSGVVRSMAVSGGSIYIITVADLGDADFTQIGSDGYIDYHEKFIEIDIESGEITERTEVKRPIAQYLASDGTLYIYSRPDNDYVLYSLNTKTKKLKKAADMNGTGYTTAFVREGNFFVFASGSGLSSKNMKNKKISVCVNGAMLPPGYDMVYHNGNIVFADTSPQDGENAFRNVFLGKNSAKPLDGKGMTMEYKGEITVFTSSYESFNTEALLRLTGINAVYDNSMRQGEDVYNAFLTSILAGDPDIDIYILNGSMDVTRGAVKTGYYVPLNDSAPIQGYFDRCFDWVGESAKATNGDTWALPVYYSMYALFYIPENMERFGVDPRDLTYLNGYIETLNRINPIKAEYFTVDDFLDRAFPKYLMQYDSFCRDSGNYDYSTPLYRGMFETLFSGCRYFLYTFEMNQYEGGLPLYHPIIQDNYHYESVYRNVLGDWDFWDPERTIFAVESADTIGGIGKFNETVLYYTENPDQYHGSLDKMPPLRNLRGWRAQPAPRLSEDIKYNYAETSYAFVNPYSKNKEFAVEYLEAAADKMLAAVTHDNPARAPFGRIPIFTLKDLSAYQGYYDMSIPLFMDIYEIYKDGATGELAFPMETTMDLFKPYFADYQDGKITLDEAIAARQREVDMWLYE